LQHDLGDKRADVLTDSGTFQWGRAFDDFGSTPLQVEITRQFAGKTGTDGAPYQLHETYQNGSASGGMYALPGRYQGLLELPQ
jgi:hypothetical protein